jgi:Ca2+-binding RTX toxin-like protein
MFGGTATNTFIAGTGNDYMQGAGTANTYVFNQNNTGQDTIANFNVATDTLQIAPNLDGNGITTTAQLLSGASVSNGNTILHLSPQGEITLLSIATPSNLAHSILVS